MTLLRLLGCALFLPLVACSEKEPEASRPAAPSPSAADVSYAEDPRIAPLLVPCAPHENRYYDRDTTEMIPVLFEKLEKGQLEPLRRAKEELGQRGEAIILPLQRFYERNLADAFSSPLSENALDVAAMTDHPGVRPMLLSAMQHPQSGVRKRAVTALLSGHVRPEDYEVLLEHVIGFEEPNLKGTFAKALFASDPERASLEFVRWLEQGKNKGLWSISVPLLVEATAKEVRDACRATWPEVPFMQRPYVAVVAINAGDTEAAAYLANELVHESPVNVTQALRACLAGGLWREVVPVLRQSGMANLRVLALDAIAAADPWNDEARGYLAEGLSDADAMVRSFALDKLIEHGDPEAIDRALAQLNEERQLLQEALSGLLEPWKNDPDLARRAFGILMDRHALEAHRPVALRGATYKAVGLLPLKEAAVFLRRIALEAGSEPIERLRAHEWLMIQAANTGVVGRTFLYSELEREEDPLRRLDLIGAVATQRDNLARSSLLELIDGNTRSPYETLYVAERLTRVGPSHIVAPALRRVFYDMEQGDVRIGMQCLLWRWY